MKWIKVTASMIMLALSGPVAAHESAAHAPCKSLTYEDAQYTVCQFDPKTVDLRLFLKDGEGKALGSFNAVNAELAKNGEELVFAMNAGMYHKNRSPVGGYQERSQEITQINTNKGQGNFHLLPNGVFWIKETRESYIDPPEVYHDAFVASTESFMEGAHFVRDYTQSGPMLVIDGKLHPKFRKGSASRKIRNGVGKTETGDIVFVKSETPVNFYDFATLFKDELAAPNALFLDGVISRLYAQNLDRNDVGAKMGPIVGVVVPKSTSEARYIANEAVLIRHGETKIMFDPLPLSGFGVYPETPEADIAQMMAGEGDYAGIDAVFISHAHSDHFSAPAMISYLTAHPHIRLVAPQQALEMMEKDVNWTPDLRVQMEIVDMEAGDAPQTITIGYITATAVRIPHAGWPDAKRAAIQNMVYRVTLNEGATVMHMGDADPRRQHFIPHKAHWDETRTDTAFPPYWFLTSSAGRYILSDEMNVEKSIGVHVPLEIPQDLKDSGQNYFSVSGETREIVTEEPSK